MCPTVGVMQPATFQRETKRFSNMTNGGFKIKTWHIIALLLAFAIYMGYITIPSINWGGQVTPVDFVCPTCGLHFATQPLLNAHITSAHPGTPQVGPTHGAAAIQFSVCDSIKGDSVTSSIQDTGVDILLANPS